MDPATQVLRNASRRPVELHFADRVEVLLPEAVIELGCAAMTEAGIAPLLNDGVLTRHDPLPPRKPRKPRGKRKGKPKGNAKAKPSTKAASGSGKPPVATKPSPATGKHAKHSGEPS